MCLMDFIELEFHLGVHVFIIKRAIIIFLIRWDDFFVYKKTEINCCTAMRITLMYFYVFFFNIIGLHR